MVVLDKQKERVEGKRLYTVEPGCLCGEVMTTLRIYRREWAGTEIEKGQGMYVYRCVGCKASRLAVRRMLPPPRPRVTRVAVR